MRPFADALIDSQFALPGQWDTSGFGHSVQRSYAAEDRVDLRLLQPIVLGTHCVHQPLGLTGSLRIMHLPSP